MIIVRKKRNTNREIDRPIEGKRERKERERGKRERKGERELMTRIFFPSFGEKKT